MGGKRMRVNDFGASTVATIRTDKVSGGVNVHLDRNRIECVSGDTTVVVSFEVKKESPQKGETQITARVTITSPEAAVK